MINNEANFILTKMTNQEGYFINNIVPVHKHVLASILTDTPTPGSVEVVEIVESNALFLIGHRLAESTDGQEVKDYYSIEDHRIGITSIVSEEQRDTLEITIRYSAEESERLKLFYGNVQPAIQIDLEDIIRIPQNQNSVDNSEISYDELSSLGQMTSEAFTVSTSTDIDMGLIIETTEAVTDVGGLSTGGRSRAISNTGATISGTSVADNLTVTTSGY